MTVSQFGVHPGQHRCVGDGNMDSTAPMHANGNSNDNDNNNDARGAGHQLAMYGPVLSRDELGRPGVGRASVDLPGRPCHQDGWHQRGTGEL